MPMRAAWRVRAAAATSLLLALALVLAGRYRPRVQVEVNGETKTLADRGTVTALLEVLGLGATLVAVERNGEIIPRARHASTELAEGDKLEVVHFVGGG